MKSGKTRSSVLLGLGLALVVAGGAGGVRADVAQPSAEPVDGADAGVDQAVLAPAETGNPYQAIVVRNAFRLKDPLPPPPPPTNAPPPQEQPKVDVKLAGLAEIRGVRYAYLMVPDTDRPGQFHYPTLTDDPQLGSVRHGSGLEVRAIDIKAKTVRVVNGGVEATINFKDNGVKNVPGAAPAAKPGSPPIPLPGGLTRPAVNTGAANPNANNAASGMAATSEAIVFSRNPNRASPGANPNTPQPIPTIGGIPASVLAPGSGSDVVVPTRPVRTGGAGGSVNPGGMPAQPEVSLQQQYEALIRQRQIADQQGIQLPPIPGVPMPTDPNP